MILSKLKKKIVLSSHIIHSVYWLPVLIVTVKWVGVGNMIWISKTLQNVEE